MQSLQAVAPVAPWYLPSAHAVHSWLLALAVYVPALQLAAAVAPAKQKVPGGHAWHSCWPLSPLALPKLPPAHGRSTLLPATQKWPSPHTAHAVCASNGW